jgi:hypothetical protein
MRSPLSHRNALIDQEELVAAFAEQLHPISTRSDVPPSRGRSALPAALLYGLHDAADYLDLTPHQLRVWLEYGGPIATISRAQGKSVDAVVDIFVQRATASLGLLAAAGWLPVTQEATLLDELDRRLGSTTWETTRTRSAA